MFLKILTSISIASSPSKTFGNGGMEGRIAVSYQSVKAAMMNPVDSLKYE